MAKKNKVIYLGAPHKYDFGSFMKGIESGKGLGKFGSQYAGLSSGMQGALGGLGSMVGQMAGSAISGGLESGAGNVISGLSSVASAIPGPWSVVAETGLGVVGGLVNAAFGTKEDKEKHQRLNQSIDYLRGFSSNATTLDGVTGPQAVSLDSNVYEGGWASKGEARSKNQELARQAQGALDKANREVINNITTLTKNQMNDLEGSYFALGGPLHSNGIDWTNGLILVDQGGTHEENPNEGVQMGVAPDGIPNLVEEGEVIWNDYVFSNRVKVPEDVRKKYKLRGSDDMTFADAVRKAQKPSAERPNDLIEMRSLEDIMTKLMMEQEKVRNRKSSPQGKKYSHGGRMGLLFAGNDNEPQFLVSSDNDYLNWLNVGSPTTPAPLKLTPIQQIARDKTAQRTDNGIVTVDNSGLGFNLIRPNDEEDAEKGRTSSKYNPLTALRYAPVVGAGLGVFSDLMGWTNKPDYSNADMILNTSKGIRDISYKPIGDYLTYKPLDRLFYSNILGAQAGATRRNILNTSGGNRGTAMAGLLAADYNAQNQLGNLFRQAEEYNLAQREKVATFNRATNSFNSEADLKAQIANAKNDEVKLDAAKAAASLRQDADTQASAARSANLTKLFNSLGAIGEDEINRMDARWLAPLIYGTGADRAPSLGGLVKRWPVAANGGRISKRKKGLTYG